MSTQEVEDPPVVLHRRQASIDFAQRDQFGLRHMVPQGRDDRLGEVLVEREQCDVWTQCRVGLRGDRASMKVTLELRFEVEGFVDVTCREPWVHLEQVWDAKPTVR